ncbi:hypothetical protein [Herbaspirillum chlorophenolicum]|uniref:hypothetical protein n=1 Tax=Herbaspirillum chlorophenolicum TaxID=211589 RepID=UPI001470C985|nr:hypothetical protein [Herbaspirillum chlorophenolicum]
MFTNRIGGKAGKGAILARLQAMPNYIRPSLHLCTGICGCSFIKQRQLIAQTPIYAIGNLLRISQKLPATAFFSTQIDANGA